MCNGNWSRRTFLLIGSCVLGGAFVRPADCQAIARPTIRDSVGVRIVEHATIRNLPIAFSIEATPSIHLGGLKTDPREEFFSRHQYLLALRMSDGRIVTNDQTALKIFDARGNILQVPQARFPRRYSPGAVLQAQSPGCSGC